MMQCKKLLLIIEQKGDTALKDEAAHSGTNKMEKTSMDKAVTTLDDFLQECAIIKEDLHLMKHKKVSG